MMSTSIRPSVTELALKSKCAIVMGVGGVSCQWWNDDGAVISDAGNWGHYILGPMIFDVNELTDIETWAPNIVGVSALSNVEGKVTCEAVIRDMLPGIPLLVDCAMVLSVCKMACAR